MTAIPFEKYHGTGNDFVVVEDDRNVGDRAAFARQVCDRDSESGVGADGVLFLDLEGDADPVRVGMSLYNPDGSTAAMCGNGARCAARWAVERTDRDVGRVVVDTRAGPRPATVEGDDVAIAMGRPSFDPADVPVARDEPLVGEAVGDLTVTAVNTGVPHAVAFVDDVDAVDLASVAPPVRHAAVFPEGANVTLAAPRDGGEGYAQRTYERGVEGETLSCGTGAVAVGAVAHRRGDLATGETVTVSPPGGDLGVRVDADGTAHLRGPAVFDFSGEVDG